MTPTIVTKGGQFYMALGAPGGSRIITAVLQVLINVIDFKMNAQDAVNFPRFHHQWRPDRLQMEPQFSPDTRKLLEQRGHVVEIVRTICEMAVIQFEENGWLAGASDPRVDGKASGY